MKDIIRLQEIEKTVGEIEVLLQNEGIPMVDDEGVGIAEVTDYDLKNIPRKNQNVETVESAVFKDHRDLKEQVKILNALELKFQGNRNAVEVLGANAQFLESDINVTLNNGGQVNDDGNYQAYDLEGADGAKVGLRYISGIVKLPQRHAFQRQVFLVTRGNSYVLFRDIEGTEEAFTFMVLYLGDKFGCQLRRLCDFMGVKIYLTSEDKSEVKLVERIHNLENENKRLVNVIAQTRRNLTVNMRIVVTKLKQWKITLTQEKAIRVTLNKFKCREKTVECQGWCPTRYIELVEDAMEVANSGKGVAQGIVRAIAPPRSEVPP